MAASGIISYAALLMLLACAAGIDVRTRKIPSWLTLSLILAGLLQSFLPGAPISPGAAIAGFTVGFILPFALFAIGALGGGDVKLLAGIGACVGPLNVLMIFAGAAVF